MNPSVSNPRPKELTDWDERYRQGTPPWDVGRPSPELVRLIEERIVPRGSVIDLGCGTGADAVFLAKRGFDVTAVDVSPIAIERARSRAEQHDALIRFVLGDALKFGQTAGTFDFVFDRGFYHAIRQTNITGFLDMLWRITRPGTIYLSLSGAPREETDDGPPQVTADQIRNELGRLFEIIELRPIRTEAVTRPEGYPGWSCLMRRPVLKSK